MRSLKNAVQEINMFSYNHGPQIRKDTDSYTSNFVI